MIQRCPICKLPTGLVLRGGNPSRPLASLPGRACCGDGPRRPDARRHEQPGGSPMEVLLGIAIVAAVAGCTVALQMAQRARRLERAYWRAVYHTPEEEDE